MKNCTCVYADYSDNLPDPFTSTKRRARKNHKCCECNRVIGPGEHYYYDSGKWDNEWLTFKMCLPCGEILDEFFCDGFAYQQMTADLYEHIQEVDGQIFENCLSALSVNAREIVCNLIDEYFANE